MGLIDRIFNKAMDAVYEDTDTKPIRKSSSPTPRPPQVPMRMEKVQSRYISEPDPYNDYGKKSDFTITYYDQLHDFDIYGKFHTPESGTNFGEHSYTMKHINKNDMSLYVQRNDLIHRSTPDFSDWSSRSVIYFKPSGHEDHKFYGTYGDMLKIAREGNDPYIKDFVNDFENLRMHMPDVVKETAKNEAARNLEDQTKRDIDISSIDFSSNNDSTYYY